MKTMVADLLPAVEGRQVRPPDDEEPLLATEQAGFGGRVPRCPPVQNAPGNGVG